MDQQIKLGPQAAQTSNPTRPVEIADKNVVKENKYCIPRSS